MNSGSTLACCGRIDETGHVSVWMRIVPHQLVGNTDFVEGPSPGETWVNPSFDNELVHSGCLLIVGEVRTLETLLHHPVITKVQSHVVPGRARANDDHSADVANKARGR